ncbi:ATP phosphoribosyltransferase regulatory subunit [Polycladidibacter hongkongensis]|uniref:ATP phosphoribosyltransferase regulatory subunit n=1 Tax=Polycladidibacter hongkongensis TaxID=1647556 RepID=UPI00082F816E|nr:ATP phosphoribosyltransferase regulatory subunit [Pseudovibrio hongkongensis]
MGQFDRGLLALANLYRDAGYEEANPPILQDADVFLDLAGEDLRKRLYLTSGEDGADLCLRPDFTIPIARHYLSSGIAGRVAAFSYAGPVFRQKPGQLGETLQAGVESIGRRDSDAADADMLSLALSSAEVLDLRDVRVRIGDEGLFTAVLQALDIPRVWQRRLRDVFGERDRLHALIARMAKGEDNRASQTGLLAALEGKDSDAAVAVVEDLLSLAGITAVGGRSAHEIAERFMEQASLASGTGVNKDAAERLNAYLNISGPPPLRAVETLHAFARETGLDLDAPIERLAKRSQLMSERGIDVDALEYSGDFGRRLDYYTGFVFEVHHRAATSGAQVIGGGRYDRLIERLGAPERVPAIGFTIWLNRLAKGEH